MKLYTEPKSRQAPPGGHGGGRVPLPPGHRQDEAAVPPGTRILGSREGGLESGGKDNTKQRNEMLLRVLK